MDKFCEDCVHNLVCQYGAFPPHKDWCSDKDTLDDLRSQDKWIPVSERLPEECGMYLVTEKVFALDDRNHRGKFKVKTEQVEFHYGKWNRAKFFEVIAWQPLPEPYKEGGAE